MRVGGLRGRGWWLWMRRGGGGSIGGESFGWRGGWRDGNRDRVYRIGFALYNSPKRSSCGDG